METKNADLSSLKIKRSPDKPKNKNLGIVAFIIIIAALVFVGKYGWNYLFDKGLEVKLISAVLQNPVQTNAALTANGYVVAQREAAVASKATGRLVYLGVVEGDEVKKNDIIAQIEDNDIVAMLEQAKANLNLSEADFKSAENAYNRQKELFNAGLSSQQELDAAEANYNRILASIEVAKAQLKSAEVSLENTKIRAPFDGTVLTKDAEVGEIVAPMSGSVTSRGAVVTMADMKSLQVEADVSESNIEKIKLKQDCEIILDAYPGKGYPGYVDKIVPTADRAKATVMVKVGFRDYDSRVLPEMSAKVVFLTEPIKESERTEKAILVIPKSAVRSDNGFNVVYKVKDNAASKIIIETGKELGNYVEILSGLSSGDRIIDSLTDEIKDGVKVRIM